MTRNRRIPRLIRRKGSRLWLPRRAPGSGIWTPGSSGSRVWLEESGIVASGGSLVSWADAGSEGLTFTEGSEGVPSVVSVNGRAGVQGIEEKQGEVGLLRVVALEAAAEIVRQMRVEQGVGHHPQNVVGEVPDIGAGGDAGGRGYIGQYARIVFAQRRRR